MKFRAKVLKENIGHLIGICQTLSKHCTHAAVFLTEEHVRMAAISESLSSSKCIAEICAQYMFSEYKIESLTVNTILFEVSIENFSKALASGKLAPLCVLKLAKRDSKPYLSFEVQSVEGIYLDVVHDIPINLLQPSDIQFYMPPSVPAPRVCLELPRGRLLKTIVDRLGKLSKHLSITAYQIGKLVLSIDHGAAIIQTHYNDIVPRYDCSLDPAHDIDNKVSVMVELKVFSQALSLFSLTYSRAVIFVQEDAAVVVHVTLHPIEVGTITFYLPVLLCEADVVENISAQITLEELP